MKSRKLRGGILGTTTQGLIKKLNKFYGDLYFEIITICRSAGKEPRCKISNPKTDFQIKLFGIMDRFQSANNMNPPTFSNVGHFFTKSKNKTKIINSNVDLPNTILIEVVSR